MLGRFFSGKHSKELRQLHGRDWGKLVVLIAVLLVIAIVVFAVFTTFGSFPADSRHLAGLEQSALSSSSPSVARLGEQISGYRTWLESKGTSGELYYFLGLAESALQSALKESGFAWFHISIMRAGFVFLAGLRLFLAAIALSVVVGIFSWRIYEEDDALGQTGNGRLYYSGINAKLENLTPQGAPDKQIVGLACPQQESDSVTRASSLGRLLEEFDAQTLTNISLAGIVLKIGDYPSWAKPGGNNNDSGLGFEEVPLVQSTEGILRLLLEKQQQIVEQVDESGLDQRPFLKEPAPDQALQLDHYLSILSGAVDQVLTPELRTALVNVSSAELATVVLAFQAGKVLAYESTAGRWEQASNFPHLAARAVLHSVAAFGKEYNFAERETVRRALIYASRASIFGPVRFAKNFTPESRSLRQLVELLMAAPNKLVSVADEVELAELVREAHVLWREEFSRTVLSLDEKYPNLIHATSTNLFLVPVQALVEISKASLPQDMLSRLTKLIERVSERQQARDLQVLEGTENLKDEVPEYEKVFAPFQKAELKELGDSHFVSPEDLRVWSSVRVVLYTYGWLARRVGDYTVPESSVVYVVMDQANSEASKNHLGLVGQAGVAPLRGERLKEQFGREWQNRFYSARTAKMAENRQHHERQMQGISDDLEEAEQLTA
ncbi:MAG: hypothetical protein KDD64_09275 [Bdellovibrionales bacterium]|nr:hypothetical protein [Bdellovibrionales bacterium]